MIFALSRKEILGMNKHRTNQFVIGLALFSMFFGAGNIIFPPYLGLGAGPDWFTGFVCYYIADIALSIVAIFALMKNDGKISNIADRIGKAPGKLMISAIILCIGPLIVLPRTGASVHEMFTVPVIGDISPAISTSLFFILVLILTIRESAVVDIIGKFMTPILFIGLLVLIICGIISPVGSISPEPMMDNVVVSGINAGYQTMDVLAAMTFGIIIIKNVMEKGYTNTAAKYRVVRNSSLIAAAGLMVIYCGLTYLGATASQIFSLSINRSQLIVNITEELMGEAGVVILGIVVILACLTTAVALVSAGADYFCSLTGGRLGYKLLSVVICIFSTIIANFGIDNIVILAQPILSLIYPGALTLIVLSLFPHRISDDTVKCAVAGAMIGSLCEVLYGQGIWSLSFVPQLPLWSVGFGWLSFAVPAGILGSIKGALKQNAASKKMKKLF